MPSTSSPEPSASRSRIPARRRHDERLARAPASGRKGATRAAGPAPAAAARPAQALGARSVPAPRRRTATRSVRGSPARGDGRRTADTAALVRAAARLGVRAAARALVRPAARLGVRPAGAGGPGPGAPAASPGRRPPPQQAGVPRSSPGRPCRPGPRWSGSRRGRWSWPGAAPAAASCADGPHGRPRCGPPRPGETNRTIARIRRQRCGVRVPLLGQRGALERDQEVHRHRVRVQLAHKEHHVDQGPRRSRPMPAIRPEQADRPAACAFCTVSTRSAYVWVVVMSPYVPSGRVEVVVVGVRAGLAQPRRPGRRESRPRQARTSTPSFCKKKEKKKKTPP